MKIFIIYYSKIRYATASTKKALHQKSLELLKAQARERNVDASSVAVSEVS